MDFYYYGERRSGKTLSTIFLTELIRIQHKKTNTPLKIFTNTDYKYKTNEIYELLYEENQSKDIHKVVLFDEIDKYIDSRNSMNKVNRLIGYFLSLSGKTNSDYLITSQIFNAIDKRTQIFMNLIISCKYDLPKNIMKWEILDTGNGKTMTKRFKFNFDYFKTLYDSQYLDAYVIKQDLDKFREIAKVYFSVNKV